MWNFYLAGVRAGYNDTDSNIIICEKEFRNDKQKAVLRCPYRSLINLTYVNYGRTQHYAEVCNSTAGESVTTCTPDTGITKISEGLCQGKQTCQLTHDGLSPQDTCPGTYKYFEVKYTCIEQGMKIRENEFVEFHPIHL